MPETTEHPAHDPALTEPASLTDRDRAVLEFERGWWKYEGAKTTAIRETFDLTPVRYYQLLNSIIDRPAALEVDPMTVRRLRRLRDRRRAQRRWINAAAGRP